MTHRFPRSRSGAPTIADVAARAGFSLMTVSRVINGEKNVRAATRDAVLEAIRHLDFAPNQAARALAGAQPIRIGLLYSNPSAAYLSRYLLGGLEQARLSHAQLIIQKCDGGADEEEATVAELIGSGVDGLILSPPMSDAPAILSLLERAPVPSVIVANARADTAISVVRMDDHAAAEAMTNHIIGLGHRRIGFIVGNPAHRASEQRERGFRAATRSAGLHIPEAYVVQGAFTYRSGLMAAEALLSLEERPTAIFASNDDMAAATVAVAHRRQLDVPGDLTVCGFDDTDFAQSIWPELTTVHQPIAQMSRTAVEMLVGRITALRAGQIEAAQDALLDFTLVRRGSDAPPRA